MVRDRKGRNGRRKEKRPLRQGAAEGYPSVLNKTVLGTLRAVPRESAEKLAENIAGCIDKNVIIAVLNGVPTSPGGINKAIRESVLEGVAAADLHRTWLAELDRIARNADDLSALQKAISAYVRQAGMESVDDPERGELYRVMGKMKKGNRKVVHPAYVDSINGRLILAGHLRYVAPEASSPAAEVETERHAGTRNRGLRDELRD